MPTPLRNIRVADDLWKAAQAVATTRGESLSAVIIAALKRYVRRHQAPAVTHPAEETIT